VSDRDEGFLSRWSRRKAQGRAGAEVEPAPPANPDPLPATASSAAPVAAPESPPTISGGAEPPPPLPTMDDVAALTRESDYARFVMPGVGDDVKSAAMKKLFSDPHFNVMDGLDTYIDDYGKPNPIPLSMLRRMNQSVTLGLFTEEADAAAEAPLPALPAVASPDGAGPAAVAQSESPVPLPAAPEHRADDDPGLQLQRDDADRRPGAGPGPRD